MKFQGLKGRIPVEPLDDERMTNIERRIVAGAADAAASAAPMRARFGLAMAFAVAAVVAIGAGFAGWQLRGDGGPKQIVAVTSREHSPVRVDTKGERTLLDIGDARIESDPLTDFTVTRPDGGVLVTMKRGKVELSVDKRGNRAPLVVAAGDTRVTVVGTRFSVDYGDGTGEVHVRVTEGVVKVERQQQEVRVAAGQAWTTKRGQIALAELPETTKPTKPGEPIAMKTIEPAGAKEDDQIEIDTQTPDVLRERQSNVPEAKQSTNPQQQPREKKPAGPEVTREQAKSSGSGSGGGSAAMDLMQSVRAQPLLAPMDVGEVPAKSISKYRQIVIEQTGREAALALYSIAYQEAMKLGRTGDALRTLDQYVRRFSGTEYKDTYHAALWLRVRILCAKGVDDRCRQAAYAHMHQATGTPAAKVSELLTLSPR